MSLAVVFSVKNLRNPKVMTRLNKDDDVANLASVELVPIMIEHLGHEGLDPVCCISVTVFKVEGIRLRNFL